MLYFIGMKARAALAQSRSVQDARLPGLHFQYLLPPEKQLSLQIIRGKAQSSSLLRFSCSESRDEGRMVGRTVISVLWEHRRYSHCLPSFLFFHSLGSESGIQGQNTVGE